MWKRQVARVLERSTRVSRFRAVARRASLHGLVPASAQQFMHVSPVFDVAVEGGDHFRYAADDADVVGRYLYWTGLSRWERESWREFVPLARRARGFLDIGAFTGSYSLVAATVNPALRAIAFEPVPTVFDRLTANVELNALSGRVTTLQAAVGSHDGVDQFFIPDRAMPDTGFLRSSLRQSEEAGTWVDVTTTTIQSVLPKDFAVDLVKIDVEDAEGPVVESVRDVLAAHRPTILIELLSTGSHSQAADVLDELGYEFFHLTDNGRVPVERPRPEPDASFMNYLCVPRRTWR